MQSLDEIGLVIFGEEYENVKSLLTDRRTYGQTDDGRQAIRKAHLSFQLRLAKNIQTITAYE